MIDPEHHIEFELFAYRTLENPGFALPIFRSCNFQSNAIYLATTEVGGDDTSRIIDFDVTEIEPDGYLDKPVKISIGMQWISVLLYKDKIFVGRISEVYRQSKKIHQKIRELSPLTMFDLAAGASSSDAAAEYDATEEFLKEKFGDSEAANILSESSLRKFVSISLARCFVGGEVPVVLPADLSNFSLDVASPRRVEVEFSDLAFMHLDEEGRFQFYNYLKEFFELFDLDFSLKGKGFSNFGSSEIDEEKPTEPMEKAGKRTRRFGLVREIAIDLGTTNTRIFSSSRGLILSQPSVVASRYKNGRKEIIAVGDDALLMEDRTPDDVVVERPLRDGAIADLDLTSEMIKAFIETSKVTPNFLRPLDVVVCVPSGSTAAQRKSIANAARTAGASKVSVILQPLAAAIGANVPILEPVGSMILTIGGGTTEVAIVSMRGVAYSTSLRMGGDKMTEAVSDHLRRSHNLLVGRSTAERIKRDFGVAAVRYADQKVTFRVRGRDLVHGVPKEITLSQVDLAEALETVTESIIEALRIALENAAPELAADIIETGIIMIGGGAKLSAMDRLIEDETGFQVHLPEEPEGLVARGIGIAMNDPSFTQVLITV